MHFVFVEIQVTTHRNTTAVLRHPVELVITRSPFFKRSLLQLEPFCQEKLCLKRCVDERTTLRTRTITSTRQSAKYEVR
jgi:hypothetical protein